MTTTTITDDINFHRMSTRDTSLYNVLGALLEHPELMKQVSKPGVSREEIKEICSKYVDNLTDRDVEEIREATQKCIT